MNQSIKPKRSVKMVQNTTDIYLQNRNRYRYSINPNNAQNKQQLETIRSFTKKSNDNNNHPQQINQGYNSIVPYSQTIAQPQKNYYKRVTQNFRRQLGKRYEQEETRMDIRMSRSPYLKQSIAGRSSSLNRSTHKIKSGHLIKQVSPHQLYKQPKSSLSHHQDLQEISKHHKRMSSVVPNQDRNYVLEEAKQLFKNNQFQRSIELLKKYIRIYSDNCQAKYFLGMSYINNNDFSSGIQELLQVIQLNPMFKKSLYLVIALAFKKLGRIEDAIQIISQGLKHFNDYYDCWIYRGKMYLKKQKYDLATKDFQKAINLNPTKGFAFVGKGTAQIQCHKYDEAIKTFTQGLSTDMRLLCLQKRGKCYFQLGKYQRAIEDFEKCSQIDSTTPIFYLKGMSYYKLKKFNQALLCFEQCLKQDTDKNNLTSSVQTMIKMKIQDKDFYEAYHILNRTQNIDVNQDVIDQWRLFLQATLFLMKKKSKDALQAYRSLLSKPLFAFRYKNIESKSIKDRFAFMKPLIHLYKGYGQLTQGNKVGAKQQYKAYDQLCADLAINCHNLSKQYNSLIIQASEQFPKKCLVALEKARDLIPIKPEPYLYLAFEKIANAEWIGKSIILTKQMISNIIDNLTISISHLPQLSNNHISSFYYYRSIIYLYNNEFNKSVADVDKAIQKSQDNIPKYFYLRGLIFACFGNFGQAIQDLSVAINLDQKYARPYLQRAKCLQIQGNSNEAFLDLQKYITLSPQDQFIHKYAGFLLFQNCAYEDCLSAFNHGPQDIVDSQITITKAKCHFLLGNYKLSLQFLDKYHQQSSSSDFSVDTKLILICDKMDNNNNRSELQNYLQTIKSIIQEKKVNDGKIFKQRDIFQLKSSLNLLLQNYEEALQDLLYSLELFQKQKQREFEKQFIQDVQEFEDQWSQIELKYNLALCQLCLSNPVKAKALLMGFEKSQQKGKNWDQFLEIIDLIVDRKTVSIKRGQQIETFQQNHRLSKNWAKIHIPNTQIQLQLAFSYPFVEPPQMMPEFNNQLFSQFRMNIVENKPQAPWINRSEKGLVFTPNIQVFDNLQLSVTTTKKNAQESEQNKPASHLDHSLDMSQSDVFLQGEALKQKFKLDSQVEMKLKKLMKKRS